MAVRMIGLVGREVTGVDVAPVAVPARTGSRTGPLQELDDARMRDREPPRELHRIAFVVPALGRHGVLVVRRDRRPVLVDAALYAVGEDLGRVGHVADDLRRCTLVHLRRAMPNRW